MIWNGVRPKDMTEEQLEAAVAYTENAISEAAAHFELLKAGYAELGEEVRRRFDMGADRTLN